MINDILRGDTEMRDRLEDVPRRIINGIGNVCKSAARLTVHNETRGENGRQPKKGVLLSKVLELAESRSVSENAATLELVNFS